MGENISKHITWKEATFSAMAVRKSIDNTPNDVQVANMKRLAEAIFEPMRMGLGDKPIRISSFYRSKELNELIGGSLSSQHRAIRGAAMDIDNEEPSNLEIFNYIKNNLVYDQLIWEFGTTTMPDWVHVSYHEGHNRMECLRSIKINGMAHYYIQQG